MDTRKQQKAQLLRDRLQLLANGYQPLPNHGKMCLLAGWPYVTITEETLTEWNRMRRPSTGLRIADGLCAIDLDVNDPLVDEVACILQDHLPEDVVEGMLIRTTSGKRTEAWFMRVDEPFTRRDTHTFKLGDGTCQVEAFGGAQARQFGAFGPHTIGSDGVKVLRSYVWEGESPLDRPLNTLPVVHKDQVEEALDAVNRYLDGRLAKITRQASDTDTAPALYDITDTMVFNLNTGDEDVTYEEIAARVKGGEKLRCSAHPWLARGHHNTSKISIGLDKEQRVMFFDFESWQCHYHVADRPVASYDDAEVSERYREMVQRLGEQDQPSLDEAMTKAPDVMEQALILSSRYGLLTEKSSFAIPYDVTPEGLGIMTISGFKTAMSRFDHYGVDKNGNPKKIASPAGLWVNLPQTLHIAGLKMRPDATYPTFAEVGKNWVNTYRPPKFDSIDGDAQFGYDFIRYLFPRQVEAEWYLDSLAHKVQFPHIPGVGIILVAMKFGVGRSTLKHLIELMFGASYVASPTYDMLTGKNSQSQFNAYLGNSLFIFIEEAASDSTELQGYSSRKHDYEVLKKIIDPRERDILITQKFLPSVTTRVCASVYIATNHMTAVWMPFDDRRTSALEHGDPKPIDDPYWPRLNAWMRDRSNIGAFYTSLARRDVSGFNPYMPLDTPMKRYMIAATSNDFDRAFKFIMQEAPGLLFTFNQVKQWLEHLRDRHELTFPKGWLDFVKRIADDKLVAVEIEDALRVYARSPEDARRFQTVGDAMEELRKNDLETDNVVNKIVKIGDHRK